MCIQHIGGYTMHTLYYNMTRMHNFIAGAKYVYNNPSEIYTIYRMFVFESTIMYVSIHIT